MTSEKWSVIINAILTCITSILSVTAFGSCVA